MEFDLSHRQQDDRLWFDAIIEMSNGLPACKLVELYQDLSAICGLNPDKEFWRIIAEEVYTKVKTNR